MVASNEGIGEFVRLKFLQNKMISFCPINPTKGLRISSNKEKIMRQKFCFMYRFIFECFRKKRMFKRKHAKIFIPFLLCVLLSLGLEKIKAQETPLIGAIRKLSPSGGCLLRLSKSSQNAVIFVLNDDGKSATMNIDGKDTTLNLVRDTEQRSGKNRKKRYVWVFQEQTSRKSKPSSEIAKVTIYLTVVGENENSVLHKATIQARKGNRRETVKAEGGCFD